jgi:diacylglycerol kinase (ATP)
MESPRKGATGFARIRNAWFHSIEGLRAALRHESAFRQEMCLGAVLALVACLLDVPAVARALMIASLLLVLIVELLNSAIEATIDRISLDRHELAKRAKDIGSAAVLLSLVNAGVVWGILLFG